MKIRPFADTDQTAVVALWQACELTRNKKAPTVDSSVKTML